MALGIVPGGTRGSWGPRMGMPPCIVSPRHWLAGQLHLPRPRVQNARALDASAAGAHGRPCQLRRRC
jgi:hypothetical protein